MSTIRVVSLVPSLTETLRAWGVVPLACTRFCEQADLTHVGGTKDPDVDAVVDLAPELVVMDTEENRLEDHDALRAAGLVVHATSIRSLEDLDAQLPGLADLVGATWAPLPSPTPPDRTMGAFVPIWKRPWMALGAPTYATSLLGRLGITNIFADSGSYPEVTLEEASARAPDVVLAPDEPYRFGERHRAELEQVAPVRFVDGADLLWWGARTPAALERLRAALSDLR